MSIPDKLKVLCLHGCRQDKKVFNEKSGHLRKILKKYGEFQYISAPNDISSFDSTDENVYKSWWYTGEGKNYNSREPSDTDTGFKESVRLVQEYISENGPFDGILGFSQGASLLGLICQMIEQKEFFADISFVVLISGFKSPCSSHQKMYNTIVKIPSLHVIGDNDSIIPKERSEELMTYFENAKILRHPGGHHVAAGKEEKEKYLNFFIEMQTLKELKKLSIKSSDSKEV